MTMTTLQAQYDSPMLTQCWSTVYDAGSALDKHKVNVCIVPAWIADDPSFPIFRTSEKYTANI